MLRCSNRSYLVRYTIILVTSRDCNHIMWFRNSASVSLLATLSHRTWIANDFSSSQLSQKRSKISDWTFWKKFLQTKIFFLIHLLYAKSTFNNNLKLYKKRWCDQMRTWFSFQYKSWFIIWLHRWLSIAVAKNVDRFSQIVVTKHLINSHKLLSRDIWYTFTDCCRESVLLRRKENLTTRFLKQREIEQICFWLMILSNHQLSFDR
jgi:hypothetical protein